MGLGHLLAQQWGMLYKMKYKINLMLPTKKLYFEAVVCLLANMLFFSHNFSPFIYLVHLERFTQNHYIFLNIFQLLFSILWNDSPSPHSSYKIIKVNHKSGLEDDSWTILRVFMDYIRVMREVTMFDLLNKSFFWVRFILNESVDSVHKTWMNLNDSFTNQTNTVEFSSMIIENQWIMT